MICESLQIPCKTCAIFKQAITNNGLSLNRFIVIVICESLQIICKTCAIFKQAITNNGLSQNRFISLSEIPDGSMFSESKCFHITNRNQPAHTLWPSKWSMSISNPLSASTRDIVTFVYRSSPLLSNTLCLKQNDHDIFN